MLINIFYKFVLFKYSNCNDYKNKKGDFFQWKKMSEFADEQRDEIEALESIYSEEIDILGDSPHW